MVDNYEYSAVQIKKCANITQQGKICFQKYGAVKIKYFFFFTVVECYQNRKSRLNVHTRRLGDTWNLVIERGKLQGEKTGLFLQ